MNRKLALSTCLSEVHRPRGEAGTDMAGPFVVSSHIAVIHEAVAKIHFKGRLSEDFI